MSTLGSEKRDVFIDNYRPELGLKKLSTMKSATKKDFSSFFKSNLHLNPSYIYKESQPHRNIEIYKQSLQSDGKPKLLFESIGLENVAII